MAFAPGDVDAKVNFGPISRLLRTLPTEDPTRSINVIVDS